MSVAPPTAPAPLQAAWWRRLLRTWGTVAVSAVAHVGGWLRAVLGLTGRLWRANLQFRVICSTMVLCLLVMTFLLAFIYQQIADGLVEGKTASAEQEARYHTMQIQSSLEQVDRTDPGTVNETVQTLLRRAQRSDSSMELIFTRSLTGTSGPARLQTISTSVDLSAIPMELRKAVNDDPTHQRTQTATILYAGVRTPALIIGSRVNVPDDEPHELYFIFPLEREAATLDMVRRTFVLGSTVVVVLIGLVAYVVTRLVVDPVREAAVVAGRLSSGHLNERMHVRGEDDLARLATSLNDMADHLQTQIAQLEDLSRVQQRFVSDVSHELRTPLTTIRMATEMLYGGRGEFEPATARSAELLHAEVGRFESLLGDLLEISRFDAGAAVLDREDSDLVELARRAVAGVEPLAERSGSTISLVTRAERLPVPCDPRRVDRILRNLLINAVEHGEGGPIEVELAGNETAVAVAVRDHGVGLLPGEADLVFTRFWRADPARRRTIGGTGLGLAISLEDARLHDGSLQAWGEPGQGSRFRLTLPRVPDRPIGLPPLPLDTSATSRTQSAAPAGGQGRTTGPPLQGASPAVAPPVTEPGSAASGEALEADAGPVWADGEGTSAGPADVVAVTDASMSHRSNKIRPPDRHRS